MDKSGAGNAPFNRFTQSTGIQIERNLLPKYLSYPDNMMQYKFGELNDRLWQSQNSGGKLSNSALRRREKRNNRVTATASVSDYRNHTVTDNWNRNRRCT